MTSVVSRTVPQNDGETFGHGINRVVVSRDGRYVATSDVNMNIEVFVDGEVVFHSNVGSPNDKIRPTERIRGLAFSPDSEFLYIAAGDKVLAIHTPVWEEGWSYTAPRSFGFLIISPISLDVAENGNVAAAFDNGSVLIWNPYGHRIESLRDNDSPRWLRFVAGGAKVIGSDSFSVCTWDIGHSPHKRKIRLKDRAFGIDVNQAGTLAAIRNLQEIVIWDMEAQQVLSTMPVGPGIPLVAFHPHKNWVAFGEKNRIRIVTVSGDLVSDFELAVASALSLAFSSDGSELWIGCTMHNLIRRSLFDVLEST